jgi:hypothetical protein
MARIPIDTSVQSQSALMPYSPPKRDIHAEDAGHLMEQRDFTQAMKSFQQGLGDTVANAGAILGMARGVTYKLKEVKGQILGEDFNDGLASISSNAGKSPSMSPDDARDEDAMEQSIGSSYSDYYDEFMNRHGKDLTEEAKASFFHAYRGAERNARIEARSKARVNDMNYITGQAKANEANLIRGADLAHYGTDMVRYEKNLTALEPIHGKISPEEKKMKLDDFADRYVSSAYSKFIDNADIDTLDPKTMWQSDDKLSKKSKQALTVEYNRKVNEKIKIQKNYVSGQMDNAYKYLNDKELIPQYLIDDVEKYDAKKAHTLIQFNDVLNKQNTKKTIKDEAKASASDKTILGKINLIQSSGISQEKQEAIINELAGNLQTVDGVVKLTKMFGNHKKLKSFLTDTENDIYNTVVGKIKTSFALDIDKDDEDYSKFLEGEAEGQEYGVFDAKTGSRWLGLSNYNYNEVDRVKDITATYEIQKGIENWAISKKQNGETFTFEELNKKREELSEPYAVEKVRREVQKAAIRNNIAVDRSAYDWVARVPISQSEATIMIVNGVKYRQIGDKWERVK